MIGMQNKTIRKQLRKKLDDWLESIDDPDLVNLIKKDVIVTGGSIASMIMGDPVNDYDLYFATKDTTKRVAEYYVEKFKASNVYDYIPEVKLIKDDSQVVIWVQSAGVLSENGSQVTDDEQDEVSNDPQIEEIDDGKTKYRPIFLSENAITLSNKIQIVIRFYGEPEEIHNNYDYVHAKCYYRYKDDVLETPVEALRSMQSKTLYYRGSLYPICSLFRMRKFISRGWKVSAGEILKMAMQISDLNLKDTRILREQLVGVDAAYFHMLLSALDSKQYDEIGTPYIIEIIDRIFSSK